MFIFVVALVGVISVLLGRWMFKRWYNHVGLYGAMWSSSLALFHIGLVQYYPLETVTWFVIAAGWLAFILGAALVVCGRYALGVGAVEAMGDAAVESKITPSILLRILWIINFITIADSIYEVYNVSRLLGGVSNIFTLGNLLYRLRVEEGVPGSIPYLGSLTLVGALLAGYYTAIIGKLRIVSIIAILTTLINSITSMVRATLIIAAILFLTGYLVSKKPKSRQFSAQFALKLRRALAVLAVLAIIIGGMELIRGNRGMTEGFAGETSALKRLHIGAGSFITPSVVMYFTVQYGVLNQYLIQDVEHQPFGHYSLAPLWRILSKLGFDTYVAQHAQFYNTPVTANTGSYLRDLHADYGIAGITLVPLLLGLITSVYWFRFQRTQALRDLIILGYTFVLVGMSLFTFNTGSGVWWASLALGLLIVSILSPRIAQK